MDLRRSTFAAGVAVCLFVLGPASASAQPLGTFAWQLQPYCNIVRLAVVQQGGQYQLDGTDNQCGVGPQASVTGLAFLNPDGTIGFGLTLVTAPGGLPVHVDATISLATLSGTWRDSAGAAGAFVFTPGAGVAGNPRPLPVATGDITGVTAGAGLVGGGVSGEVALAVNFATTQQRVTGACGAGTFVAGVNQDGTVTCAASISGGDITDVIAGAGLTGGATSGSATLAVAFAGFGTANSVARSDHTHRLGDFTLGTGNYGTWWVDAAGGYQAHLFRWGFGNGALYLTNAGGSDLTGVYLLPGATSLTSSSDERLKSDITPVTGILDRISNIRVVSFNMASLAVDPASGKAVANHNVQARTRRDGTVIKQQIGSIAQDWIKEFPELVVEPQNDDEYYGLNYDRIGVVALGGVKELTTLVAEKDVEIEALKERLSALEQMLKQIKGQLGTATDPR